MSIKIKPFTPAIGVEISRVDINATLPTSIIEEIYQLLVQHLVIVFRNQNCTPQAQIKFCAQFGELDRPHPIYPQVEGFSEIVKLEHDADHPPDNNEWHTDLTFRENPPFASVLQAVTIPDIGGDTMWASMHAAYDALPNLMQQQLELLYAVHDMGSFRNTALGAKHDISALNEALAQTGSVVHKVVKYHPTTNRPMLYVNQGFTRHLVGMTIDESDRLLHYLYSHTCRPEFQMRLRWQQGDVVMWDNRATQHYALADYAPAYRCMHRVTIVTDRRAN